MINESATSLKQLLKNCALLYSIKIDNDWIVCLNTTMIYTSCNKSKDRTCVYHLLKYFNRDAFKYVYAYRRDCVLL